MSNDCLVMKMIEEETESNGEQCTYVFYDYKHKVFGVRHGYITNEGKKKEVSYYVDKKEVLLDFLLEICDNVRQVNVSLMSYKFYTEHSDNITFEYLEDNSSLAACISAYSYNDEFDEFSDLEEEEEEDDDEELFPNANIAKYLDIMKAVYNEY